MSTAVFRRARIDDIPLLNVISVKSKKYWGYPDNWMEKWVDELHLVEDDFQSQDILVIEIENQISGFCSIAKQNKTSEILHLWLLPEYIGKGYGRQLLDEAIKAFIPKENKIVVEADPNAESFYRKNGFVTIDQIESYPEGRYLPFMKRLR